MSTRAVIEIYDETQNLLVAIFNHWDGMPERLGKKIYNTLKGHILTNGVEYPENENDGKFSSMGCLSAYLIGELKEHRKGNIYIIRQNNFDYAAADYIYKIYPVGDSIFIKVIDQSEMKIIEIFDKNINYFFKQKQ